MAVLPPLLLLLLPALLANPLLIPHPLPHPYFRPQSFAWDPTHNSFLFASLSNSSFFSLPISPHGPDVSSSILDPIPSLPSHGSSISSMAVDPPRSRLWVVARITHSFSSDFGAVACYDLNTKARLFLSSTLEASTHAADTNGNENSEDPNPNYSNLLQVKMRPSPIYSHIAVASSGDAYLTDLEADRIFKIHHSSDSISIFSESSIFVKSQEVPSRDALRGLSGIVAISEQYLLVAQPRSGRLYRVSLHDPEDVRVVDMDAPLLSAQGLAVRKDGILVAVSDTSVWAIKSRDEWNSAYILEQQALDTSGHATTMCLKPTQDNAFILQFPQDSGSDFALREIQLPNDPDNDPLWLVLIPVAVLFFIGGYYLQMRYFLHKYNKRAKRH